MIYFQPVGVGKFENLVPQYGDENYEDFLASVEGKYKEFLKKIPINPSDVTYQVISLHLHVFGLLLSY